MNPDCFWYPCVSWMSTIFEIHSTVLEPMDLNINVATGCWDTYKKINLKLHPPAAKAWQVSRHTPTLVWSLTLSMMLFSSENVPPTVLPWPLMFSNTDHMEGQNVKEGTTSATNPLSIVSYSAWLCAEVHLPALVRSWKTAWGLSFTNVLQFVHAFRCSEFVTPAAF